MCLLLRCGGMNACMHFSGWLPAQRGYDDFVKLVDEEIVWKAIAGAFDEPRAKGGSQLPFGSKVTPCLGVIARVSFPRER